MLTCIFLKYDWINLIFLNGLKGKEKLKKLTKIEGLYMQSSSNMQIKF